mmetsp:Transcript_14436/g.22406  ORF Transcript_14436/g.22406 Transcript_14436/m.22406 type:complete len:217 (-) Transcript_14436:1118-1768(-)
MGLTWSWTPIVNCWKPKADEWSFMLKGSGCFPNSEAEAYTSGFWLLQRLEANKLQVEFGTPINYLRGIKRGFIRYPCTLWYQFLSSRPKTFPVTASCLSPSGSSIVSVLAAALLTFQASSCSLPSTASIAVSNPSAATISKALTAASRTACSLSCIPAISASTTSWSPLTAIRSTASTAAFRTCQFVWCSMVSINAFVTVASPGTELFQRASMAAC